MNVIDLLDSELKNKNWTLEEKQRYVYLRSCQIFSFDPRYQLCRYLPNNYQTQQEIRNKTIDLTNVTDFNVVCTSYSKYVINVLLEELLNIKSTFEGNDHNYITSLVNEKNFKIDGTVTDIFRIKLNMSTNGYQLLPRNVYYNEELMNIDKKINYIESEYGEHHIKNKRNEIFNSLSDFKSNLDFFNFILTEIKKLYQSYHLSHNFSDAKFCIAYLILHIFNSYDQESIKDVTLFLDNDKQNWDFVKLYAIDLEDEMLYWCLEKQDKNFTFHEISRNEAKHYVKNMKGINKEYIK